MCDSLLASERKTCLRPVSPHARPVPGIWDADGLFRCPLVGVGLSGKEQKRLLRKMSFPTAELTAFEIHELLVGASATENPLSRRISLLLRRKYEREAVALRRLDEAAFLARWKEAFAAGRYAPFLWAAATRGLSDEARREVYGAIHMAMHGLAEEQMRTRRTIAELERRNGQQASRLRNLREQEAALRHEKERAEEEARRLVCAYEALRRERDRQPQAEPRPGRALEAERDSLRAALSSAHRRLEEQERLVRDLLRERGAFGPRVVSPVCGEACCGRACDDTCPSFDLCQKRVLIVGGVERMETLYRSFIERGGGELDYHNGSLQGGTRQLEKCLLRADIILCPVNCNSHGACVKVKNLAKKHHKTFYMLPNGSLSTISRLLGGHEGETS